MKRMDTEGLAAAIDAVMRVPSGKYTPWYKVQDLGKKLADLAGLPMTSLTREISTFVNNIVNVTQSDYARYVITKSLYAIDYPSNKSLFYDDLYRAWRKDDKSDYNKIRADMVAHGFEDKDIDSELRKRVKAKNTEYAEKTDKVSGDISNTVSAHPAYLRLDTEYQEKAQKYIDDYAMTKALLEKFPDYEPSDNYAWVEKADSVSSKGIETWEYVVYKTLLLEGRDEKRVEEKNEDAQLNQEEKIKLLNGISWLSRKEKVTLILLDNPKASSNSLAKIK